MKTARDILTNYRAKCVTQGRYPLFTCTATLPDGGRIIGYGSTLEGAEDTAWHGIAITLRKKQPIARQPQPIETPPCTLTI